MTNKTPKSMGSKEYENEEVLLPTSMVNTNILIERNKKGFKQVYMAKKLGIAEKSYRNIELGITKTIQIDRLKKIASILEMKDWNDLLKQHDKVTQKTCCKLIFIYKKNTFL